MNDICDICVKEDAHKLTLIGWRMLCESCMEKYHNKSLMPNICPECGKEFFGDICENPKCKDPWTIDNILSMKRAMKSAREKPSKPWIPLGERQKTDWKPIILALVAFMILLAIMYVHYLARAT